jgi:hypothetical protein
MSAGGYQYLAFDDFERLKDQDGVVDGYEIVYGGRQKRPPPTMPTIQPPRGVERPLPGVSADSYPKMAAHPVGKKVSRA